jgi:hypothetical protein
LQNETQGIGIGMSTADTLANVLGGYLNIQTCTISPNRGTKAEFGILTTSSLAPEKFHADIVSYTEKEKW